MSYKLTCPSCDTYTSAVFRAYVDGLPCPHCGEKLYGAETAHQYYRQLCGGERIAALDHLMARATTVWPKPVWSDPSQYIKAVHDETHVHTDAELAAAVSPETGPTQGPGWRIVEMTTAGADEPGLREAALAAYERIAGDIPTFVDGEAATDAIIEFAHRQRQAAFDAEEAQIRAELTGRIRAAIEIALEGHRGAHRVYVDHMLDTAAAAAVDAVAQYSRDRMGNANA